MKNYTFIGVLTFSLLLALAALLVRVTTLRRPLGITINNFVYRTNLTEVNSIPKDPGYTNVTIKNFVTYTNSTKILATRPEVNSELPIWYVHIPGLPVVKLRSPSGQFDRIEVVLKAYPATVWSEEEWNAGPGSLPEYLKATRKLEDRTKLNP